MLSEYICVCLKQVDSLFLLIVYIIVKLLLKIMQEITGEGHW